jgi:hypothetical protein
MNKTKEFSNNPKISVRIVRTFGNASLLTLYSEYVAQKICKEVQCQIKSHL